MSADQFFLYARKRYQLMLNKEADFERPWTNDPILQEYRFCNIFREDDKVTKWIRKHVTFEKYGDKLLGAMVIARWFNRVETLEHLSAPDGCNPKFDLCSSWADDMDGWESSMRRVLKDVKPLVTGAYMIKTPAGMSKLDGIIWCLKAFLPHAQQLQRLFQYPEWTLEAATDELVCFPYLGPFMAYEVVTDLRHTPVLHKAPDIMSWANPGPGCARGLARVLGLPIDTFNRHSEKHIKEMTEHMRGLLMLSRKLHYWPQRWPKWEMREVEHTLCEFDKYERARLGEGTPKQRYRNGA